MKKNLYKLIDTYGLSINHFPNDDYVLICELSSSIKLYKNERTEEEHALLDFRMKAL